MKFSFDNYRIVYLRNKKVEKPLHKDYTYYLPWNDLFNFETLKGDDYKAEERGRQPTGLLTEIINKYKVDYEWKNILSRVRMKYPEEDLGKVFEGIEKRSTPREVVDNSDKLKNRIPEDALKELVREAVRIEGRLTIFVLPSLLRNELMKSRTIIGIIDAIADDVDTYFRGYAFNDSYQMPFSFAIEAEETKEDTVNIIDEVVDRLLVNMNEGSFHDLKNHMLKEGPVLLEGRTGTGKTMFARLFAKQYAARKHREVTFRHVNVSGIPETLIESRIRGTVPGLATGVGPNPGWFEKANNGVLFLDEFQNVDEWVQTQLLDLMDPLSNRVLVTRLGDDKNRTLNVKVLIAVNEPVQELLHRGKLRKDIYHRIRQTVSVPSFRDLIDGSDAIRGGFNKAGFIRKLIYIYRWKHPLVINDENLNKAFPEISMEEVESLSTKTWDGNFREFERRMADNLWDWDNSTAKTDRPSLVENETQTSGLLMSDDRTIINVVVSALKKHNYLFKRACEELKIYRMASAPTLRKFLRNNFSKLPEDVQRFPKIKKLDKS